MNHFCRQDILTSIWNTAGRRRRLESRCRKKEPIGFQSHKRQMRVPFTIFANFECFTEKDEHLPAQSIESLPEGVPVTPTIRFCYRVKYVPGIRIGKESLTAFQAQTKPTSASQRRLIRPGDEVHRPCRFMPNSLKPGGKSYDSHQIFTSEINKVALRLKDTKRHILPDVNYHPSPWTLQNKWIQSKFTASSSLTSPCQIRNWQRAVTALGIPCFRGVFMRDTLPPSPRRIECGILNHDSWEVPGTHWTCWYKRGPVKYNFDFMD
ncbi:unnamed protein product [Mytilus edulis]|uniref:Uncharacterized protein n=1 Tax=Mytilus edulis TaxID=6550 RepID=A0A8S3UAI4_MYTED|nr:unnamed protein product [Mytilus edulis]